MEMSFKFWEAQALINFSLSMFLLAVLFILLHIALRIRTVSFYEIVYRWMAVFALGMTGIYSFLMHVFYPDLFAAVVSRMAWAPSPFQFEVAMADLALGVLGILSFRASYSFRLATVIAAVIILGGDAVAHAYQESNPAISFVDTWFWLDIIVPMILLLCLIKQK